MLSQRAIIAVSVAASVAVHVSAVIVLPRLFPESHTSFVLQRRTRGLADQKETSPPPPPLPPLPPPLPEPEPPPELPRVQMIPLDQFIVGRQNGTGDGNESIDGGRQTALFEGPNQAHVSREPTAIADQKQQQQRQEKQQREIRGLDLPQVRDLKGVGSKAGIAKIAEGLPFYKEGVQGTSVNPKSTAPTPEMAQGVQKADDDEKAEGRREAQAKVDVKGSEAETVGQKGQDRPQAETDSDLFSEQVDIEIRAGKVESRLGRQMKFVSPRINLAAIIDAATLVRPLTMKLRVDVDENGVVRNVIIEKSSGSPSVDRAYELAAYQSWFEPAMRNGKPVRQMVSVGFAQY